MLVNSHQGLDRKVQVCHLGKQGACFSQNSILYFLLETLCSGWQQNFSPWCSINWANALSQCRQNPDTRSATFCWQEHYWCVSPTAKCCLRNKMLMVERPTVKTSQTKCVQSVGFLLPACAKVLPRVRPSSLLCFCCGFLHGLLLFWHAGSYTHARFPPPTHRLAISIGALRSKQP